MAQPVSSGRSPSVSIERSSVTTLSESGRSALFTTWRSATSSRPALIAWMSSPMPGTDDDDRRVREAARSSTSAWPTPTVSTITKSQPAASSTVTASNVARDSAAQRIRAWTSSGRRCPDRACAAASGCGPRGSSRRVSELDGSTATIATVLSRARNSPASAPTRVLLPLPGAPVTPTIVRVSPLRRTGREGCSRCRGSGTPGPRSAARSRARGPRAHARGALRSGLSSGVEVLSEKIPSIDHPPGLELRPLKVPLASTARPCRDAERRAQRGLDPVAELRCAASSFPSEVLYSTCTASVSIVSSRDTMMRCSPP